MRTEKEIRDELKRCEKERDKHGYSTDTGRRSNIRYWALKWVLGERSENES
ncbi:MAG: hypothetical protein PHE79_05220 [Eubacteriales bacterium]|nr:hypothetical protein [Eubacteriales bacterium]